MNQYKVNVDKDLLKEVFTLQNSKLTSAHFKEVDKIINIIFIKYHNQHYFMKEELTSLVYAALLKKKESFNPEMGAYNFVYTICRNEIGNFLIKYSREQSVSDFGSVRESYVSSDSFVEFPPEMARYSKILTGEESVVLRVPKKDIIPIVIYARLRRPNKSVVLPRFLLDNNSEELLNILYKMLISEV